MVGEPCPLHLVLWLLACPQRPTSIPPSARDQNLRVMMPPGLKWTLQNLGSSGYVRFFHLKEEENLRETQEQAKGPRSAPQSPGAEGPTFPAF